MTGGTTLPSRYTSEVAAGDAIARVIPVQHEYLFAVGPKKKTYKYPSIEARLPFWAFCMYVSHGRCGPLLLEWEGHPLPWIPLGRFVTSCNSFEPGAISRSGSVSADTGLCGRHKTRNKERQKHHDSSILQSPLFFLTWSIMFCLRRSTKVGNNILARLDHRNQLTGTHAAGWDEAVGLRNGSLGFSRLGDPPDNLSDCRAG